MKFCQKCGGQNRKIGLTFFPPKCSNFFSQKGRLLSPKQKVFDNFAITCDFEDQKENDVFTKNLFYSKLIRDQNYIICTCQKIHFPNKIMRLQFSPDST